MPAKPARAVATIFFAAGLAMTSGCSSDDLIPISPAGAGGSGARDDGGSQPDAAVNGADAADGKAGSMEAGPRCIRMPCPVVLATGVATPEGLAVDGTYVYWTDLGNDDRVHRVPKAGGAPSLIGFWEYSIPGEGLVVDAKNVYWTLSGGASAGVMKVGVDDKNLVTLFDNPIEPERMVVDATSVYWVEPAGGNVQKIPIDGVPDGGAPITLFKRQNVDDEPKSLAIDANNVYVAVEGNFFGGSIMKVPIGGGPAVMLASLPYEPVDIAVDATTVYFAMAGSTGGIMKIPLEGGTPTMLAPGSAFRIAIDASHVYWSDIVNDTLMRVPLTGGTPEVLAGGSALAIALDATSLYWLDYGTQTPDVPGGFVVKLEK